MVGHRRPPARGRRDAVFVASAVLGCGLLGLGVAVVTGEADLSQLWPHPTVSGPAPLEVAPTSEWPAGMTVGPPTPPPIPHDQGE